MKFQIDDITQVYTGFLKILKAKVTFDSFEKGKSIVADREMMDRGDSVAVLLFERDTQCFLLTQQFRFPTAIKDQTDNKLNAGWLIEIPAGKIEENEDPQECAKREVLEELGYNCHHMELISHFYVSPGGTSERIWLYFTEVSANDKIETGGGVVDEKEDISMVRYDTEKFIQEMKRGEIRDAKTIVAFQWWLLNKK
jgi:nudix-type nucleoside diphosphatase (YffH/AdpP family)